MIVFELAKEKCRYEYVQIVEKTNCIDKKKGHRYSWVYGKEAEEIRRQHPSLKYGAVCKCNICGKVTSST